MKQLDLDVIEEPGSTVHCYQCAHCGMAYRFGVPDGRGGYTPARDSQDNEATIPDNCRRCGAPMDYKLVHEAGGYADQQAEAATNTVPVRSRRHTNRMVGQAPINKTN